jgi:hypothetical protein
LQRVKRTAAAQQHTPIASKRSKFPTWVNVKTVPLPGKIDQPSLHTLGCGKCDHGAIIRAQVERRKKHFSFAFAQPLGE